MAKYFWQISVDMVKWLEKVTFYIQQLIDVPLDHGVWKSQKKVSFNIASEASYVYILSRQKFFKNAKKGQFCHFLENRSLWSNSDTREVNFNLTKIGRKCQNSNGTFRVISKQRVDCYTIHKY